MNKQSDFAPCPCDSGTLYGNCCGPLHAGRAHAATAVQLMRSRYSAFALGKTQYLLETWLPGSCPGSLEPDPAQRWIGLKIVEETAGDTDRDEDFVTFVARYKIGGKAFRLKERSRFMRVGHQWYYADGDLET